MRVTTWNVNGIRARFFELVDLCGRERPDLLCLQELKAAASQVPEPLTGLPDYVGVWHGGPRGYSGVSLHVRRAVASRPTLTPPTFDIESRVIELQRDDLRVLSVYVPNGNRNLAAKIEFLEALCRHVEGLHAAGAKVVVCGDLNVARAEIDVHPRMRGPTAIGQLPAERALFQRLLDAGLVDLARAFEPDNAGLYTWWPPWREERRKNRGWRLDYILVSTALAARAERCGVLADFGTSDHAPVQADLAVQLA